MFYRYGDEFNPDRFVGESYTPPPPDLLSFPEDPEGTAEKYTKLMLGLWVEDTAVFDKLRRRARQMASPRFSRPPGAERTPPQLDAHDARVAPWLRRRRIAAIAMASVATVGLAAYGLSKVESKPPKPLRAQMAQNVAVLGELGICADDMRAQLAYDSALAKRGQIDSARLEEDRTAIDVAVAGELPCVKAQQDATTSLSMLYTGKTARVMRSDLTTYVMADWHNQAMAVKGQLDLSDVNSVNYDALHDFVAAGDTVKPYGTDGLLK